MCRRLLLLGEGDRADGVCRLLCSTGASVATGSIPTIELVVWSACMCVEGVLACDIIRSVYWRERRFC